MQHPDCSSAAKLMLRIPSYGLNSVFAPFLYYLGTLVAVISAVKDPFLLSPPQGLGLRGARCKEAATGSNSPTSTVRSSVLDASMRRSPAHSKSMLSCAGLLSLIHPAEAQDQGHPSREVSLELRSKRLIIKATTETRALMVNKQITWTTTASVKKLQTHSQRLILLWFIFPFLSRISHCLSDQHP